jgi:rhomboid protease GluP
VKPNVNIFLGTDWEGLRQQGASWPEDVVSNGQYYRLFTALFVPIGFFRLCWDLVALRFFAYRCEKLHGPLFLFSIFMFGGFGGHGFEAAMAPAWLSTGAGPGLMALYVAFAVDLYRERKEYSGVLLDILCMCGFIASSLLLAGFPGSGMYGQIGGAVFGLVAKLLCCCVDDLQRKCSRPGRMYTAIMVLLMVCVVLTWGMTALLTAAKDRQLCKGCMNLCYDVACMCDATKRLNVPPWAFTPDQLAALG